MIAVLMVVKRQGGSVVACRVYLDNWYDVCWATRYGAESDASIRKAADTNRGLAYQVCGTPLQ